MNPETQARVTPAALVLALAVIVALGAIPASAGVAPEDNPWEQSPDCDQRVAVRYLTPHPRPIQKWRGGLERIAVWRRLPLVNTRHIRDGGATGRSPLPEIAFPGAAGSEIPTHAGRQWMNPPAGLVKSRWDWAAMVRHTSLQAFPPTQIAPTGYISYTIRP
ncbi:MAG: hypothetical protein H5T64_13100, partial [Chloroflexi bacterium]|nr:hypothetical protein [Chloroflexota bacterium]